MLICDCGFMRLAVLKIGCNSLGSTSSPCLNKSCNIFSVNNPRFCSISLSKGALLVNGTGPWTCVRKREQGSILCEHSAIKLVVPSGLLPLFFLGVDRAYIRLY